MTDIFKIYIAYPIRLIDPYIRVEVTIIPMIYLILLDCKYLFKPRLRLIFYEFFASQNQRITNPMVSRKPLYLIGPSGSGKSEIAQHLLQQHHIIHITREHIKFTKDIAKYIEDSLFRKNVLMMMATTSSVNDMKALLIDDIQVFVKHDKPSLKKMITLIKQCSATYKIICCGHPTNDKSVQSLLKMCYTVDITPVTRLPVTNNQPSLKSDSRHSIYRILVTLLFRLCSSEYSITSLNLLENYPTVVKRISPHKLASIYTSICYDTIWNINIFIQI